MHRLAAQAEIALCGKLNLLPCFIPEIAAWVYIKLVTKLLQLICNLDATK